MKIVTIAEVPDQLGQAWLQHLRDFDAAHPGCHFQVTAAAPGATMAEVIDMLKVDPPLPSQLFIKGREP